MGKTIKCGIMSPREYAKRTVAIAKGEYKPKIDEPKVWFESPMTMAQVLSPDNVRLLDIIDKFKPNSLKSLAEISGRHKSNLTRTLKTMEKYGIVSLERKNRNVIPIAHATEFDCRWGAEFIQS
jgi:predicted transcriptional regulator